jgi:UDP-2-acetamido-3-amino-2,3-dideoxy-glucuronate N-acetyltransferase
MGKGVPVPFGVEEPLAEELRHFAACVIERNQPLTDGASGVRVLDILERAQRCLERGQQKETVEPRRDLPSHVRVHPTAIVDDNVSIGEGTSIWHFSHIQPHSKIGRNCTIGQNVNIANNVVIGDYVKIQNNVSIYEGVELEDYVFCGPSMVFTNVLTPRCEFPQRGSEHYLPTKVGYGASLGANSTIVCGTTVGRFAFVGAGAVVTRDVPEYALVVGNPARLIGWMCRCGTRLELGKGTMTCGKCGECYELHGEVLSPILTHSGIAISK